MKQTEPSQADAEESLVNFDTLVEAYQAPLLRYAYRLARDEELARDIVQEAFIRYLEAPPRARMRRQIVTWLYRVTHKRRLRAARHFQWLNRKDSFESLDLLVGIYSSPPFSS